jgi:hypothetical protein
MMQNSYELLYDDMTKPSLAVVDGLTAVLNLFASQMSKNKVDFEAVMRAFHLKLLGMSGIFTVH